MGGSLRNTFATRCLTCSTTDRHDEELKPLLELCRIGLFYVVED